MPDVRIRAARPADAADLLVCKRDAIVSIDHDRYDPSQLAAWAPDGRDLDAFDEALSAEEYEVRVAETDDGVAGYAVLNRATGTIDAVFVDPESDRSGIGRQLVGVLETTASVAGLDEITVSASLNAAEFYAKLGYEPFEQTTRPFGNVALPVVRMRKSMDGT
ncbi:MAG: GNAT family N-acetyltransferase [Halococcoides sp.]